MQTFILTNFFWFHVCDVRSIPFNVVQAVAAAAVTALICAPANASIIFTNIVLYRNLKLPQWIVLYLYGERLTLARAAQGAHCTPFVEWQGKVALLFAKLITLHRTRMRKNGSVAKAIRDEERRSRLFCVARLTHTGNEQKRYSAVLLAD